MLEPRFTHFQLQTRISKMVKQMKGRSDPVGAEDVFTNEEVCSEDALSSEDNVTDQLSG